MAFHGFWHRNGWCYIVVSGRLEGGLLSKVRQKHALATKSTQFSPNQKSLKLLLLNFRKDTEFRNHVLTSLKMFVASWDLFLTALATVPDMFRDCLVHF